MGNDFDGVVVKVGLGSDVVAPRSGEIPQAEKSKVSFSSTKVAGEYTYYARIMTQAVMTCRRTENLRI